MADLWHELMDPVPAEKMDATGLWRGACACGYRSAPTTEARARAAAEEHYEAVMSDVSIVLLTCLYCPVKSTGGSESSAFLMWMGHWADEVKRGDPAHPNPPEVPGPEHYESLRLSKEHVRLMGGTR